ncbi:acyl-CoA dehydrogenase family protein [Actinomadura madurae]|nr:acyl-CoA dehydrogenase family protein [Actinomadura madurae]MCP9948221.1 acyl-CoA dehydrogenase family protein [Actinomadura madurae]MCP9977484.1 acyl-CoA dehydrogenase family protein [Actinomadura madurae]
MTALADHHEIRELAAKVAAEMFEPLAARMDLDRTPVPPDRRAALGDLGFLGIALPERYGGSGAPLPQALAVIEEFAKVCRPAAFQIFEANTGPAQVVNHLGTEEQRARWLPPSSPARRPWRSRSPSRTRARPPPTCAPAPSASAAATSSTASSAGSPTGVRPTSTSCTAGLSDAPGAKGIGAVVVEKGMPGLSFGAPERLMGFRGIPSADVILDGVRVPDENVVVPAGDFGRLFGVFSIERLGNSTMSLAIGQAALDATREYVQEREQFGRPLVEFQTVQVTLADMLLQVESARLLVERAAAGAGTGLPDPLHTSLAKCAANEMAKRVTDLAMQVHGGNGYTEEYGIERLHRDAHGWAIAGGTPTMQRIRIVSESLGRRFDQRR